MLKKPILFFLLGFLILFQNPAQAQIADVIKEPDLLLKKHFTGNLFIHNLGWGFGVRYGKMKNIRRDLVYEFDFLKMKHPKEVRSFNPAVPNPAAYIYGKLNSMFITRYGLGYHKLLFEKGEKNGLQIRYNLSGGFDLGILKPVYLEIIESVIDFRVPRKYDPNLHFNDNIYGSADFSYGLDELFVRPGIYGKFAMIFEFSEYNEDYRSIETGITIDYFPQKVPVMAFIDNKNAFISFYLSIHLGKRWGNN